MSNLSNRELMNSIKESSKKAYKLLYDRLWKSHFSLSYAILGDRDLAKDVVQEVWVSLWERRNILDVEKIEAYLYRAIKFKSYKEIRNTSYREKLVQDFFESPSFEFSENNIESQYHLKELNETISSTISSLPKKCKEVFELSRNEGLKNNEISDKLQISKRTVETHISNALKVLRTKVALTITITITLISSFF